MNISHVIIENMGGRDQSQVKIKFKKFEKLKSIPKTYQKVITMTCVFEALRRKPAHRVSSINSYLFVLSVCGTQEKTGLIRKSPSGKPQGPRLYYSNNHLGSVGVHLLAPVRHWLESLPGFIGQRPKTLTIPTGSIPRWKPSTRPSRVLVPLSGPLMLCCWMTSSLPGPWPLVIASSDCPWCPTMRRR